MRMTTLRAALAAAVAALTVAVPLIPADAAAAAPAPQADGAAPASAARTAPRDLASTVDPAVARILREDRIPGAAVTVVSGDRTVFSKGYGTADIRTRVPVDPDRTGFYLGSLAKLFTAQAAARLVAEDRIDPKADINDTLRAVTVPRTYPGRPVTLNHLLTHTGGFDSDLVGRNKATPKDLESLSESLTTRRPPRIRPPGTVAAYDNYGYALAGQVVADASGQSFPSYVRKHILDPLGMRHTSLAQPQPSDLAVASARGYRPVGDSGQAVVRGQYGAWTPSGPGVTGTAADMGRWMSGQLTGRSEAARLMQRAHYRQDPRMPGLGWGLEEWRRGGRTGWFKDGDIPGFHSNLLLLPKQRLGVFVVFNGDGTDGRANWDGKRLIDRIVAAAAPAPEGTRPAGPAGTGTTGGGPTGAGSTADGLADRTGGEAGDDTGDASGDDQADYTGDYRAARVSRTSLMAVEGLFGAVSVRPDGSRGLRTTGLSLDPAVSEQRWTPLGGGLFRERGVPAAEAATIAFADDGTLVSSALPSTAYEELAWHQSPALHQSLFASGLGVLLLAALGFPVLAAVRRLRHRPPHRPAARAARATAAVSGLLAAGFTAALAAVVADGNRMMELTPLGSPLLTVVTTLGAALVPVALALSAGMVACWLRGWWGVTGRLLYTVTVAGCLALLGMLLHYRLVGAPFAWLLA